MALASRGWTHYESILREVGKQRFHGKLSELTFLSSIGFVSAANPPTLTETGSRYFQAEFLREDRPVALGLLQLALLSQPEVASIVQALDGVPSANRAKAGLVLRSQGFGETLNDRSLGSTLSLMDRAELIRYSKHDGRLSVLMHASHSEIPPPSIIIGPETPFSNRVWLRRILEECSGFIYWLDKHFLPAGLESLWEASDGNRVEKIRVLSLSPEHNSAHKAIRQYRDLKRELLHKGIRLDWNVIDSVSIRDTHDRWIIGSSTARNVPDVNSILSGRRSELNLSAHPATLVKVFDEYWTKSVEIGASNPKVNEAA